MYNDDVLEIPIEKTKNVNDLVRWFENKKVYEKKHPAVSLKVQEELPHMLIIGAFLLIGMALLVLEEKGKLKAKTKKLRNGSTRKFLSAIQNSKSENTIERLIESRYNIDIIWHSSQQSPSVMETKSEYTLDDVFGIWKNKKNSLDKVREEQWGKRK